MSRVFHQRLAGKEFVFEVFLSLYGMWNLDFFRSFDLGNFLGTDTLALDITVGLYSLLFTIFSYICITETSYYGNHSRSFLGTGIITALHQTGKRES